MTKYITYKYKIYGNQKDFDHLDKMARDVNLVWNYYNELSEHCYRSRPRQILVNKKGESVMGYRLHYVNEYGKSGSEMQHIDCFKGYISAYDMQKLSAGATKFLEIDSATINEIADVYAKSRITKAKLITKGLIKFKKGKKRNKTFIGWRSRYRDSGWIPLKGASIRFDHATNILTLKKRGYKVNIDRPVDGEIKSAQLVKEAGGWFVCLVIAHETKPINKTLAEEVIGVDFGLKDFITTSTGQKLNLDEQPKFFVWGHENEGPKAIDALKSKRDVAKNRATKEGRLDQYRKSAKYKIMNKKIKKLEQSMKEFRKNQHFQIAHQLLDMGQTIVMGDLSGKFIQAAAGKKSKKLSLGNFRERLRWLAEKRGQEVVEVNESNTTKMCSTCGELTGPTGTEGLKVREWACDRCGSTHDRDVNAAKNIKNLFLSGHTKSKKAKAS